MPGNLKINPLNLQFFNQAKNISMDSESSNQNSRKISQEVPELWSHIQTSKQRLLLYIYRWLILKLHFLGITRTGVYAQARILSSRHETREPAHDGTWSCQDCRFWFSSRNPIPAPVYGLRVHQVVPSTRSSTPQVRFHFLRVSRDCEIWDTVCPNKHGNWVTILISSS